MMRRSAKSLSLMAMLVTLIAAPSLSNEKELARILVRNLQPRPWTVMSWQREILQESSRRLALMLQIQAEADLGLGRYPTPVEDSVSLARLLTKEGEQGEILNLVNDARRLAGTPGLSPEESRSLLEDIGAHAFENMAEEVEESENFSELLEAQIDLALEFESRRRQGDPDPCCCRQISDLTQLPKKALPARLRRIRGEILQQIRRAFRYSVLKPWISTMSAMVVEIEERWASGECVCGSCDEKR